MVLLRECSESSYINSQLFVKWLKKFISHLPGHTTHRFQPLDVAVYKQFQLNYNSAVRNWLRTNPDQRVTQSAVAELLAEAYGRSAALSNATNGFRAS
ncbi:hypothetical protein PR048_032015 [Dryococelus australis]|uniref:DDE-1 domain-containing protein n=1 Tax=Dryococelus australis TaxID=614101 RepID=A0ABQ9G6X0_9NEOP|nr:hypothetical protein PR048_032015 [Dryococelus australis]